MINNYIIVGLDDSAASRAAHRWAAAYAHATGKDLCAVHVLDWPIGLNASAVKSGTRFYVPTQEIAEPYWQGMHRVFDDTYSPQGSVLRFAQGDVGDVLVRLSTHADLLVVGTREPVRARSPYLAGSVSHYCISHARCPVVTVPELLTKPLHDLPGDSTRYQDTAVAASRHCDRPAGASRCPRPVAGHPRSSSDLRQRRHSDRADQLPPPVPLRATSSRGP